MKKILVSLFGTDSAQILPPCCSTIFFAIARPRPKPFFCFVEISEANCTNGLKIIFKHFSSIPIPLSVTQNINYSSVSLTESSISLSVFSLGINFIELFIRFEITCLILSLSKY